jgi:hypothetical protein
LTNRAIGPSKNRSHRARGKLVIKIAGGETAGVASTVAGAAAAAAEVVDTE